ncbi:acyl carrier protein [Telmatocola sphagniphila]|uniref:Acyl carrier protein n=1 Tax=Telmatocola sphagniphila TaxID=1123043 RepID=A0A8E6BA88_9BACT|nr:acyl carrier protein [Telmatocola sphagniphila]
MNEIHIKIQEILEEFTGNEIELSKMDPSTPLLIAFEVNSLDILEIIFRIEEIYGIRLSREQLETHNSLGGFLELVNSQIEPSLSVRGRTSSTK